MEKERLIVSDNFSQLQNILKAFFWSQKFRRQMYIRNNREDAQKIERYDEHGQSVTRLERLPNSFCVIRCKGCYEISNQKPDHETLSDNHIGRI